MFFSSRWSSCFQRSFSTVRGFGVGNCQAQEDLDKVKQLDIDDMWLQDGVGVGRCFV